MQSSMVTSATKFDFAGVKLLGFYIKECRAISARASPLQKICLGVSKIVDFRHVDMEGQMKEALPV